MSSPDTYSLQGRLNEARTVLDEAVKEYVLAMRRCKLSDVELVSDINDVLAWATDGEVKIKRDE